MSEADTVYLKWARRLDPIAVISGQIVAWLIIPMVLALTYEVVSVTCLMHPPCGPTT